MKGRNKHLFLLLCMFVSLSVSSRNLRNVKNRFDNGFPSELSSYFHNYYNGAYTSNDRILVEDIYIDSISSILQIYLNEGFSSQPFTPALVEKIYSNVKGLLPEYLKDYQLQIFADGVLIEQLIPSIYLSHLDSTRCYGKADYKGAPWVTRTSLPYSISKGLQNRHLCVWASHGKFYNHKKQQWVWQRPRLYCTSEDLLTQTFVVPYLIPMLENAGAIVFTPRERDWQVHELIVDNDTPDRNGLYAEQEGKQSWEVYPEGFAYPQAENIVHENPFTLGTSKYTETTTSTRNLSYVFWNFNVQKEGDYAVYVSYKTLPTSVPDANYTVVHQGMRTNFKVNQKMGSGTWTYLGTFRFSPNDPENNGVYLSNLSKYRGHVSADAVRIGGGMGNVLRGDSLLSFPEISGLPRYLEAAKYAAQWYGFPQETFNIRGDDDYSDDINSRPNVANFLSGGSFFLPYDSGLAVPIELSMALHSDAGYRADDSFFGSLSIYSSEFYDGKTAYGLSRLVSRDLADIVMTQVMEDITKTYGDWTRRQMYNRNYGETRDPQVPAIILEMFSHQNWADMKYAHDPQFKFLYSRAVYKGILKFLSHIHGNSHNYVVQPLPVKNIQAVVANNRNCINLSWAAVTDPLEPTAMPTHYIIYHQRGNEDYDNGTLVDANHTSYSIEVDANMLHRFKVAAVNAGGRSFCSPEVCAYVNEDIHAPHILLVDGFSRLAGPQPINNETLCGFEMNADPGVIDVKSPGFCGAQLYFNKDGYGKESSVGLGFSGDELEGMLLRGNGHDNAVRTAVDILPYGNYTISSTTSDGCRDMDPSLFQLVYVVLGAQKDDGYSLSRSKTFSPNMQQLLTQYAHKGGNILVSGAFIGSDMLSMDEQQFTRNVLKFEYQGSLHTDNISHLHGMNTDFLIYSNPSEESYWVKNVDIIQPVGQAFCSALYQDYGLSAGIAYKGSDFHVMAFGFPLDIIQDEAIRRSIISSSIQFLINQ